MLAGIERVYDAEVVERGLQRLWRDIEDSEDNDATGEWGGILGPSELQPTTNESDLPGLHSELVKPPRIGSRRDE